VPSRAPLTGSTGQLAALARVRGSCGGRRTPSRRYAPVRIQVDNRRKVVVLVPVQFVAGHQHPFGGGYGVGEPQRCAPAFRKQTAARCRARPDAPPGLRGERPPRLRALASRDERLVNFDFCNEFVRQVRPDMPGIVHSDQLRLGVYEIGLRPKDQHPDHDGNAPNPADASGLGSLSQ
jgi:hypothetical protein